MRQITYWNTVSAEKEFTTDLQVNEFSKYVSREQMIIDIGCGYGRTMDQLFRLGYRNLLGFDFSQAMIARAAKSFPLLEFRLMANEKTDLPDESADAVILLAVLTCIAEDSVQENLMKEVRRILKPNGILYINDFLLNQDERNLSRYEKFKDIYGSYGVFELPEGAVLRHHTEERIQGLVNRFAQKEYRRLIFKTMNGHTSNGFFYIGSKK